MGSVILITGASSGFGRDAAERLARQGHHVIATMRDIAGRNRQHRVSIETLAAAEGLPLQVLELDVTSESSIENAVTIAVERAGRIDVVINNAGFAGLGVTEAYTAEQFHQTFDVNVYGVVRVNRAVLPHMRARRSGLLIHVSSVGGRVVVPAMAAYCASKFALEALADTYRYELVPFGIDSILVEPGTYRTPIFEKIQQPADLQRVADYGHHGQYVDRVREVFQGAISAPDAPGSEEVADALVRLVEMDAAQRPFRTIVSAPVRPLIEPYNTMAEQLRPIIAQIFNIPELAGSARAAAAE
jgi:NAD(P)-dependent dehydrogenase (short-subunit alcohol dehydrogenase family)